MYQYLKNSELKVEKYLESTKTYLYNKFNVPSKIYSYANPVGQVILVTKNISRLVFFYVRDIANQQNFSTANRTNTVHGLAQLQGHNSFRGSASKTVIKLKLRDGLDINNRKSTKIILPNNLRLECLENGLTYSLSLSDEYLSLSMIGFSYIKIPISQGTYNSKEIVSDGSDLQTYPITIAPNQMVDQDAVFVEVNGYRYNKYLSLSNAIFMDRLVIVKTGLSSGFDLVFGKKNSCIIPKSGEKIVVKYLIHDGVIGNIENPTFKFIDSGVDYDGEAVDLNQLFSIENTFKTWFGADPEDIDVTKLIAPNVAPNNLIHDQKSLVYALNMLNMFQNVKIKKSKVTYTMFLYQRIRQMLVGDQDYFNFTITKLLLSSSEKVRLLEALNEKKSQNIEINIENPKLINFGLNIIVEVYESKMVSEDDIKHDIRDFLSNYMIGLKRLNKIPMSDIMGGIDKLNSVDSVLVNFMVSDKKYIDSMGNIVLGETEICVMRGGFINLVGAYVDDTFDVDSSNSVVNIDIRLIK
jgi:hypothetical protein